jgi:hypothetical protein
MIPYGKNDVKSYVFVNGTVQQAQDKIRELLSQGWVLYGPPITGNEYAQYFGQAMVQLNERYVP